MLYKYKMLYYLSVTNKCLGTRHTNIQLSSYIYYTITYVIYTYITIGRLVNEDFTVKKLTWTLFCRLSIIYIDYNHKKGKLKVV